MKKVTLVFYTHEEVSPELLCSKVGQACAKGGALYPLEEIGTSNDSVRFRVVEEDYVDNLGLQVREIRPV
jgi:hypothetical protein